MSETLLQDETELALAAGDVQLEIGIPSEARELAIEYVDRSLIAPDPDQPRVDADAELKASIAAEGIRQPIQVRPHPERLGEYMIIDGERRWRGAAGVMDSVPCIVRNDHDHDVRRLIGQIVSNTGKPLTPMEEARAFHRILATGISQADLARQLGRPRTTVGDRVRLMELGPWIPLIESGEIPVAHAIEHLVPLRGIPDKFHVHLIEKLRKDFRFNRNAEGEEGEKGEVIPNGMSSYDFGNVLDQLARPLFYPLVKTKASYDKQPEFDTRAHDAECSCGGIQRGEFHGDDDTRRWCGNPDWWRPLHRSAIAAKSAKSKASKKGGAALPTWARLPAEASARQEKYYYTARKGEYEIVDSGEWNVGALKFDPDAFLAQVDPAKLILVTCGDKKPSIATTDVAALKAAQASYAERLASRRAAYVEKRADALGKAMGDADYAVRGDGTAAILALVARDTRAARLLLSAAELLGLEIPEQKKGWFDTTDIAKWAAALETRPATVLATALVAMVAQRWQSIDEALEKSAQSEHANLRRIPMRWPGTPAPKDGATKKAKKAAPAPAAELTCIACGCMEDNACEGGCAWLAVDKKRNAGVCSECAADKAEAREMLKDHASADGD